jgi:hypothetical protein
MNMEINISESLKIQRPPGEGNGTYRGWPELISGVIQLDVGGENFTVYDVNLIAFLHALAAAMYRLTMVAGSTKIVFEGGPALEIACGAELMRASCVYTDDGRTDISKISDTVTVVKLLGWTQAVAQIIAAELDKQDNALDYISKLGLEAGVVDRNEGIAYYHVYW